MLVKNSNHLIIAVSAFDYRLLSVDFLESGKEKQKRKNPTSAPTPVSGILGFFFVEK